MLKKLLLLMIIAVAAGIPAGLMAQTKKTEGSQYVYVSLTTNQGEIILQLDNEKAPLTVANFVNYVNDGHYSGTIFHRVIPSFMIQGGGMNAEMSEKTTKEPVKNEANNGLKNNKYTVAMARTSDPHSATAQFFINTKDNEFLNFKSENGNNWGYAVFGQVIKGQEVVDAIEKVDTKSASFHDDVPVSPVVIEKAQVLEDYKPGK